MNKTNTTIIRQDGNMISNVNKNVNTFEKFNTVNTKRCLGIIVNRPTRKAGDWDEFDIFSDLDIDYGWDD